MSTLRRTYFIISICLTGFLVAQQRLDLPDVQWKLRQVGSEQWYPATVPGCVHTDLMQAGKIPDPYLAENEAKVQWVENEDWEYSAEFNLIAKQLQNKHVQLCFEGLDTYAQVYVNNQLILSADNMFRTWRVEVKDKLQEGKNTLRIVFASAVKTGKAKAKELNYTLPGDEKVFTRKAQYQYGWDWGPRLVTCGIWKPVYLESWEEARISAVQYVQKRLTDSVAELLFITEIEADTTGNIHLQLVKEGLGSPPYEKKVKVKKGLQKDTMVYTIDHPKLWWCNGLGDPERYLFALTLQDGNYANRTYRLNIGLRTLELVRTPDLFGSSFYFKLNGQPVFMKGANYIPPDNFLSRKTPQDYGEIVSAAKAANMNMLRVWGGGVYADDAFYQACDERGILVWQDFMFACSMYPGDDAYQKNVLAEAKDQILRLQHHPSIALWCGNNEVQEGWDNWGWQRQYKYTAADSTQIACDNTVLFDDLLALTVADYDPDRAKNYVPSSPQIGWGHKESLLRGDSHYWGVWWGMEPFETYEKKVGRFMSEYGFQGMPSAALWKSCCKDETLSLSSACIQAHQKHPTGYKTIQTYLERDYKTPTTFEDYTYVSQLLQARGMAIAIEAHRRAKPYCMGTLYWQLNDCWPVTSWSSIDVAGNYKAVYYKAKALFKNRILSITHEQQNYRIYAVSDTLDTVPGTLKLALLNFKGDTLFRKQFATTLAANTSSVIAELSDTALPAFDTTAAYLSACFVPSSKKENLKALYYFAAPKSLKLPEPRLKLKVDARKGLVYVSSKTFVKDLWIDLQTQGLQLDNNAFDLEPGEKKQIKIISYLYKTPKPKPVWKSLYSINTASETKKN